MKSKMHFEKIDSSCVSLGCVSCRGGTVINIHVFLPLKVTVLAGQECRV